VDIEEGFLENPKILGLALGYKESVAIDFYFY